MPLETRFPSFSGYPTLTTPNTSLDEVHPKPDPEVRLIGNF